VLVKARRLASSSQGTIVSFASQASRQEGGSRVEPRFSCSVASLRSSLNSRRRKKYAIWSGDSADSTASRLWAPVQTSLYSQGTIRPCQERQSAKGLARVAPHNRHQCPYTGQYLLFPSSTLLHSHSSTTATLIQHTSSPRLRLVGSDASTNGRPYASEAFSEQW
jgi:hypothetical protein